MRDGPPVSEREITDQDGRRDVCGCRHEPGEIHAEQARDVWIGRRVTERTTCTDREKRPAALREQLMNCDTPVRRVERREHDQANRREDRARDHGINDHKRQRASERVRHSLHKQRHRHESDDPRRGAPKQEAQQFKRSWIRFERDLPAITRTDASPQIDQQDSARAPARKRRDHAKQDLRERLPAPASENGPQLFCRCVRTGHPVMHGRAALAQIRLDRCNARRNRSEQVAVARSGRCRRRGRGTLGICTQPLQVGDQLFTFWIALQRADQAVQRARQFGPASRRRCRSSLRRRGWRRRTTRRTVDDVLHPSGQRGCSQIDVRCQQNEEAGHGQP
ncbi:hypothetical protein AWB67_07302 [Caballeronia terrestris]|uniref:Uncharacterized protein n=1 Tax=Caballeronia terrestris TaxID=1226301 RepID=A0A158L1J8_9BURK|nr:hypothetical protein AWB67_07302 [Caballeronia terrestris]